MFDRAVPSPAVSRLNLALVFATGLLLVGFLGAGCTSDSSGSSAPPDTTTASPERATAPGESAVASSPRPSSSAADTSRPVSEQLDDARVQARVKQALAREDRLRVFNFRPQVVNGRVTLRGDVDTREQYDYAARVAQRLEGVDTLVNEITVEGEPVSNDAEQASTASSTSVSDGSAAYHTVQAGESLWSIAREYDTSVQRIQALNDISSSLQPGQRIRIP